MKFKDNAAGDSNLRPKVSGIKPLLLGQHTHTLHIAGTSYSPLEHPYYVSTSKLVNSILRIFVTPFHVHFCRKITQFQNIAIQPHSTFTYFSFLQITITRNFRKRLSIRTQFSSSPKHSTTDFPKRELDKI